VDCATLAHELARAAMKGDDASWTTRAFGVLERGVTEGGLVSNLVVVGVFEAMQSDAYRGEPPDAIERRLGPASLAAWADLIEGWTGAGIRTVDHWRRVVINGPCTRVTWTEGSSGFRASIKVRDRVDAIDGASVTSWTGERSSEQSLDAGTAARIVAAVRPLVALAVLPTQEGTTPEPVATLEVDGAQGPRRVTLLRPLDVGYLATNGARWFAIDPSELRALSAALRNA